MTEIFRPSDFEGMHTQIKGHKLFRPNLQRPAIPAAPVDAVLVPPPTVQPAFDEFLQWVLDHVKASFPEGVLVDKYRIRGWEYHEPTVFPDRTTGAPFIVVIVGADMVNRREEKFEVGALTWVDLDTSGFWLREEDPHLSFCQSRTNDTVRNWIERAPDEDGS